MEAKDITEFVCLDTNRLTWERWESVWSKKIRKGRCLWRKRLELGCVYRSLSVVIPVVVLLECFLGVVEKYPKWTKNAEMTLLLVLLVMLVYFLHHLLLTDAWRVCFMLLSCRVPGVQMVHWEKRAQKALRWKSIPPLVHPTFFQDFLNRSLYFHRVKKVTPDKKESQDS